jgi:hypothetical protein
MSGIGGLERIRVNPEISKRFPVCLIGPLLIAIDVVKSDRFQEIKEFSVAIGFYGPLDCL